MFKVLVSDPISDLGIQQLMDASDVTVDKKQDLVKTSLLQSSANTTAYSFAARQP